MTSRNWQPPADVFRCDDDWYIKLELAGIQPGEVRISAHQNTLSVSGTRRDSVFQSTPSYQSLEITYSSFSRNIALPFIIDPESIRWDYQDGMLLICLSSANRDASP